MDGENKPLIESDKKSFLQKYKKYLIITAIIIVIIIVTILVIVFAFPKPDDQQFVVVSKPAIQPRTYNVMDFVQYTRDGTDLPGQPMSGTVADCIKKCDESDICLGFSRAKSDAETSVGNCWLKKEITSPIQNDRTYHTYKKPSI